MADESNGGQTAGQAEGQPEAQAASLRVLGQYVKDLSFESPGAPGTLQRTKAPKIGISVGVQVNPINEENVEVELKIEASGKDGETTVFAVELVYAGIFQMQNIPQENFQALTMVECPRLLFPFARQVVADATRNGGFPPLMIDPIDFVTLFRQQVAAAQQGAAAQPGPASN